MVARKIFELSDLFESNYDNGGFRDLNGDLDSSIKIEKEKKKNEKFNILKENFLSF